MANSIFGALDTTIFETMSRMAAEAGAINLGQGFPEGLEPEEVVEAAIAALRSGPHQYPPMAGLPALRQAVAENARRFLGLSVDWEKEVLVTSGATEALADAFFGLLEPGDEVIVFEPAYDSYQPIIRRAGAVPVPVRVAPPDWGLPFERLEAAITPKTRAFILNTPWNPIGRILREEELRFLADLMLKHDLVAICDEVYEHLVFDGRQHRTLFALPEVRDRVVRIGSAGKTFSVTGWKVGYITACEALLKPIMRAHQFVTFTTPPALQAAVAFGLNLPDAYFGGLRAELEGRRDLLVGGLRAAGLAVEDVEATYFAIAATGEAEPDDVAFCRAMTFEAGVTAVPLSAFYGKGDMRSHIRFCFAKREETLRGAVERIAAWREKRERLAAVG
ncbi:aspartate/methionine/tyrosine aminotransferase [Rhodopseudomonas julia]|uniref:Aspartate/methionine/tyrosine aminotransferase n=1 Tax=Rhodopseudomonas julia TaxID=200617 RepID=A0ABU0C188_9BRAD|nr:aminotransferase [Rhodopseudomonas julia]MDQ0324284.1 aspartate/methionine/tyrosine aminotransferase [Rhodopseudomonas julia]